MTAVPTRAPLVVGVRAERILAVAVVSSALLKWAFAGIALVDVVLALGILSMRPSRADPAMRRLLRRCIAPLWIFALGSAVALSPVGFTGWAMFTLATDAFLLAAFFATYRIARRLDAAQWTTVLLGVGVAIAIVAATVVLRGGYRPEGTFNNPNYTAHWMAVAALFAVVTFPWLAARVAVVAVALAVMVRTGSFGGMALLAVGLCFAAYLHARRPSTHFYWRLVTVVLAVCSVMAFDRAFERFEEDPSVAVNAGVSSARFQWSSQLRRQLWDQGIDLATSNPGGVGPHGIASRDLLGRGAEIHNDYLAALIERGVIGAVGLGLLIIALWRSSRKGGVFRTLLVGAAVAAVFRETLHFRHLWLFLALALAWDDLRAQATRGEPTTSVPRP